MIFLIIEGGGIRYLSKKVYVAVLGILMLLIFQIPFYIVGIDEHMKFARFALFNGNFVNTNIKRTIIFTSEPARMEIQDNKHPKKSLPNSFFTVDSHFDFFKNISKDAKDYFLNSKLELNNESIHVETKDEDGIQGWDFYKVAKLDSSELILMDYNDGVADSIKYTKVSSYNNLKP